MSQSDQGKAAASPTDKSKQHLTAIAELLNVPLSIFLQSNTDPKIKTEILFLEKSELLGFYISLSLEARQKLLAYARQLAKNQD